MHGGPEVKKQMIPSHNANTRKETRTISADEIVRLKRRRIPDNPWCRELKN